MFKTIPDYDININDVRYNNVLPICDDIAMTYGSKPSKQGINSIIDTYELLFTIVLTDSERQEIYTSFNKE